MKKTALACLSVALFSTSPFISAATNGDGTDDIVWQYRNGQVHYWPMRNGKRLGGINIHTPVNKAAWTLAGVGNIE